MVFTCTRWSRWSRGLVGCVTSKARLCVPRGSRGRVPGGLGQGLSCERLHLPSRAAVTLSQRRCRFPVTSTSTVSGHAGAQPHRSSAPALREDTVNSPCVPSVLGAMSSHTAPDGSPYGSARGAGVCEVAVKHGFRVCLRGCFKRDERLGCWTEGDLTHLGGHLLAHRGLSGQQGRGRVGLFSVRPGPTFCPRSSD